MDGRWLLMLWMGWLLVSAGERTDLASFQRAAAWLRLAQNVLVTAGATVATTSDPLADEMRDAFWGLSALLAAAKVPGLGLAAALELPLSLAGELSDIPALVAPAGFFAELFGGDATCHEWWTLGSLIANNVLVTALFNAVNARLQAAYPAEEHAARRHVLRAAALVGANTLVPGMLFAASWVELIPMVPSTALDLLMLIFLYNALPHIAAEAIGYEVQRLCSPTVATA